MNITEIKIRRSMSSGRLRALVSIVLDNEIAIHDIKVIEGPERMFVAMPSRKESDGRFRDIVHPLNSEIRAYLEEKILAEYQSAAPQETEFANESKDDNRDEDDN